MAWTTPATWVSGAILTAAQLNTQLRDNLNALYTPVQRLAYQTRTSNYTVAGTEPGTANIFASNLTWTADGSSTYVVEFFCSALLTATNAGAQAWISFVNASGTSLGRHAEISPADGTRSNGGPVYIRWYYTPTAGTATLNARGWRSTADGSLLAGNGGAGNPVPAFMAVYGPNLT